MPLGLHLNLTEGPPTADVDEVPSLVVWQTNWWPAASTATTARDESARHMRGKAGLREALSKCEISLEEVGREVCAQFKVFKQMTGVLPAYLDGHQHVHVLPGIAAVVARIAADHGIRCVRMPDEPPRHFEEHVEPARAAFYRSVSAEGADARAVFADEGVASPDSFLGLGLMGQDLSPERLFLRLEAVLADAAADAPAACERDHEAMLLHGSGQSLGDCHSGSVDGSALHRGQSMKQDGYVVEYMCHVGLASVQGDSFNMSPEREHELNILLLPIVRQWLDQHGFELCSYQDLGNRRACHYMHNVWTGVGRVEKVDAHCEVTGESRLQAGEDSRTDRESEAGDKMPERDRTLMILSSMTAATGNATTAQRLASVAQRHGWNVLCKDIAEVPTVADLEASIQHAGVSAVLGVHAFRAGRLLRSTRVPYSIILGGTDVNVMVADADKRMAMQHALDRASAVVSFSRPMLSAMRQHLHFDGPCFIMPQAAHLPSCPTSIANTPFASMGLPETARIYLLPCGLRDIKDPTFLVQAFSEWHASDPRIFLCIVGPSLDASCESNLVAAIQATLLPLRERNGASDGIVSRAISHAENTETVVHPKTDEGANYVKGRGVVYHKPIGHAELVHWMRQSEAVVNSSRAEGMCGSLLEALAISIPVLARAAPGNLALIRHQRTGLLYNTADECVALARSWLADNKKRQALVTCGKHYAQTYHSDHTESLVLRRVLALLVT